MQIASDICINSQNPHQATMMMVVKDLNDFQPFQSEKPDFPTAKATQLPIHSP